MSLHSVDYEIDDPPPPSIPPPLPKKTIATPAAAPAPAPTTLPAPPSVPASAVEAPPPAAAPSVSRRLHGEDLVDAIFTQGHALPFLDDALEAARFCVGVLQTLIPCGSAMVHFFDVTRAEFIVVDARGEGAEDMILKRHGPGDPLMRVVLPMKKAFAWNDLSCAPARRLPRFANVGEVKRVLVSPIMLDGRCLGAIELVNPDDGEPFGFSDESAVDYLAQSLATFLSSHGVIVDVATIAHFAFS